MAGLKLRDLVARLRIVFDKKAEKESTDAVQSGFDKITGMAKVAGAAIAAAFAIDRLVAFGKAAVRAAQESEVPWNRLANTLRNAGVEFKNVEDRIRLAAAAMQDTTTHDGEQFAELLDELTAKTGDFELAFANAQLTADVAAKFFNGELGPAIDVVTKALNGQTRGLREVGIVTKDAAEGLRILRERSAGAAANELETLSGQVKQLGNDFGDFQEELGGLLADLALGTGAFEFLRTAIQKVTEGIRRLRETDKETQDRLRAPLDEDQRQELIRQGVLKAPTVKPRQLTAEQIAAAEKAAAAIVEKHFEEWQAGAVMAAVTATVAGGGALRARAPQLAADSILRGGPGALGQQMTGLDLLLHGDAIDRVHQGFADIESAGTNAMFGIAGAWQDLTAVLLQDISNLGGAFEALGRGVTGALLGGVSQYASAKVKENIALAFEETAKGIAALANPLLAATAPGHFVAAAKFAGVATLWGALAGGSAAGQSAVAGGGRGGVSGGIPSGASDVGSRLIENGGPQTIIYVSGFDPRNPVHVRLFGQGMREVSKTDSSIDVRPWDGRLR